MRRGNPIPGLSHRDAPGLHALRRVGVPFHRALRSVLRAAARLHPGRLSALLTTALLTTARLATALLTTALLTTALLATALWLQAAIWLFVNEVLKGCALRHEEWIGADGERVRECGLYPELPTWWFLPLAGALCGYATNLIAMWLIFKPIEPTTYLGCVTLHGLFLRRQDQACPYHGCTYYGPFPAQRSQAFGGAPTVCTLHALTMHSPCTHHAPTMHPPCTYHAPTMHSPCAHFRPLLVSGLRGVRDHLRRAIAHGAELLGADPLRAAQPPPREDRRAPGDPPHWPRACSHGSPVALLPTAGRRGATRAMPVLAMPPPPLR